MSLTNFWTKYVHIHKNVGAVAIDTPSVFIDLHCKSGFFFLCIKTKHSDKLYCEADLKWVVCCKVTN